MKLSFTIENKKLLLSLVQKNMTEYFTLNAAKKHKSRKHPIPFLVAHECDKTYKDKSTGEIKEKNREYFAFDSIEDFIEMREKYPHSHEVVWDRFVPNKQQGRLVFDFDYTEAWYGLKPKYVCPDFQTKIEKAIKDVFEIYYEDVDVRKLEFVWLTSDTIEKWSKHLVVKHAYFCNDWKMQSLIFYNLLLAYIHDTKLFDRPTKDLIDEQVVRNNATMRMVGSSKLGGKVLTIDEPEKYNFFDSLIQLYRGEDVRNEQNITQIQLKKKKLSDLFYDNSHLIAENEYLKQVCIHSQIDTSMKTFEYVQEEISEEEGRCAFEVLNEKYPGMFKYKNVFNSMINLERVKSAPCPISGRVHDNENAFLVVTIHNDLYFVCRRGCKKDDKKSIKIT